MKISYRTHPVLKTLADPRIPEGVYLEPGNPHNHSTLSQLHRVFSKVWPDFRKDACKNIDVLSTPFADAVLASGNKLFTPDAFKELKDSSGVLIFKHLAIAYRLRRAIIQGKGASIVDMIMFKNGVIVSCMFYEENLTFAPQPIIEEARCENKFDYIRAECSFLQQVLLFKMFAPVETKFVEANKRVKGISCKYVNDTDLNINHLDCTYFTNLIRSEGFDVRGHFRLQPKKKNGQWTHEMIWIKPFEKHGYTRKAGILNQTT